jgi:hypothetical protein
MDLSKPVICKPELVILALQKFYNSRDDMDKIMPYLLGTAPISLRLIDFFVTNYCRKNFISYPLNGQEFLVYVSYKSQLKAYSKQFFDPNCRRERIVFQIQGYEPFRTTVGQLNFFRWAFENQLLEYIQEHYDEIQEDRIACQKRNNLTQSSISTVSSEASTLTVDSAESFRTVVSSDTIRSNKTQRRQRSKQIPAAIQQVMRHDVCIQIAFD